MVCMKNKRAKIAFLKLLLINFYHKRTIIILLKVRDSKSNGELIRRNDFILIQPGLRKVKWRSA